MADEDTLVRFAHVSRALSRCSTQAQEALEAYYGDVGCYFQREFGDATIGAYLMSPASDKLLRGAPVGTPHYVTLGRLIRENAIRKDPNTTRLLTSASEYARRLVARACDEWREACEQSSGRPSAGGAA